MSAVPGLDVILMDLQYVPALLTPDKLGKAERMVAYIARTGKRANVNVFRRYATATGRPSVSPCRSTW